MATQNETQKTPPLQELCNFIQYKDQKFNFWNPARTGDISKDSQIGHFYAIQYLDLAHKYPAEAFTLLADIVRDMRKVTFNMLEIAFLETISDAFISLLGSTEGIRKAHDAWQNTMWHQLWCVEEDARMKGNVARMN